MMSDAGDSAPKARRDAPAGRGRSRADRAYAELRRMITTAEVSPGERLAEVAIAEWLGVSRTPVREALQRLEREGLTQRGSRGGFTVAGLSPREVRETCELRVLLDTALFQRATTAITPDEAERLIVLAERLCTAARSGDMDGWTDADESFHQIVDVAADQQLLATLARNLREQLHRFALLSTALQGRLIACADEHMALARAVRAGDTAAVAAAVADHMAATRTSVLRLTHAAPFVGGGDIWLRLADGGERNGGRVGE